MTATLIDRLVLGTRKTGNGCIEWTRGTSNGGYGVIVGRVEDGFRPRHRIRTHRASYEAFVAKIPDGLHVLHACDNPRCINPAHLFAGTDRDNAQDKVGKGRHPRGEKASSVKITEAEVKEIRRLYSAGQNSQPELAHRFGLDQSTISYICNGKRWKHLL